MGSNNEVEFFCGVGLDITGHKRAEEALHESEERFRSLSEAAFEGIAITEKGIIIDANGSIAQMLGYAHDEIIGMNVMDLVAPESRDLVKEKISAGNEAPYEHLAIRKDRSIIHVEVRGKAISYKGRSARVTSIRDITARKQTEDKMVRVSEEENQRREELEKLREISQSMRQAERSSSLLEVFTREVQEFCKADIVASILYKASDEPIYCFDREGDNQLNEKQKEAIVAFLLELKNGNSKATIPGLESVFGLPLQSSETIHGAVLVASRSDDQIKPDERNMLNAMADMAGTALHRIDILETLEERVQQRTHDLVVLYNLITIISENWRLQDLLELSLVLTLETLEADRGIIYLVDGKETPDLKPVIQRGFGDGFEIAVSHLPDDVLANNVLRQHKPLSLDNLAENPAYEKFNGMNSYAGIPILARGEVRGVFSLFANEKGAFGSDEMALLSSIADHLGIGIDNSLLWEQSRENAALEERNRLARNLHDSVSQQLYSLTLMAGSTKKMLEHGHDLEAVKNSVSRLGDTAHQALKEMRLLLYELRPAVLDSEGLISALQHRVETVEGRLGVRVDLQANGLPDLPSNMEDALYHIALEALNNIVKHSGSTQANIRVNSKGENIVMEISDNGKGFNTDQYQKGLGLRNMRERGEMLGGEVEVASTPGEGTCVRVKVKHPSIPLAEL
jgi:PAS domain S-box-containing protein